jgi:hypothetical protein
MGIVIVKIDKKPHLDSYMESKNGLCWDHKQIENAFSIIWWHNKWKAKAMYNKILVFQLYLAPCEPLAPFVHVFFLEKPS